MTFQGGHMTQVLPVGPHVENPQAQVGCGEESMGLLVTCSQSRQETQQTYIQDT